MLSRLNSKTTLALGFALVVLLLIGNAVISYRNIGIVVDNNARVEATYEIIHELEETLSSVKDAETGQRGFVITGDPEYLAPYNSGVQAAEGHLERLRELVVDPETERSLGTLEQQIDARAATLRRVIDVRRNEGVEAARAIILRGEGKAEMDAVRRTAARIGARQDALLTERATQARTGVRTALATFAISTVVSLGLLLAVWRFIRRDADLRERNAKILEGNARQATLAAEVGLALTRSDPLEKVLQSCATAVVRNLDASFARIWTINAYEDTLELQATAGTDTRPNANADRIPIGSGKIGRIAQERTPYFTNAVVGDPRIDDQEWARREGMVAFAGYPLLVDGHLLGVVSMFAKHDFSPETLRALATVADTLALGIRRKRTEEDLERAKEAAEEANRTKSLFLANMSHELRTPLNAILGYSEMLREEAEDARMPGFIPDLDKINIAGRHLLSLINDILDLSKIEAGKMELYVEEFDVAALVQEVASTVRPLVDKNSNTLQIQIAPNVGTMHSDMTKTRQCLFNLLSNAAKFTQEGTISLQVAREPMEGVASGGPSDWMVFRITDTGIGMSADQILGLFQAFSQADASTTRKFGGTGLGLALTRKFSQMMGGDVTVQSVPGEGSTFTIKILAVADAKAAEEEGVELVELTGEGLANVDETPAPGTCVLVIDDDPTERDLMRRFLMKEGFPAQTAKSGEEGLRLARRLRPLAITLDVMMPGLDGWSVLTALKADPELRDIPVIMLTMVDDKKRGFAMGAVDYATKPVDRARLAQILQRYVCSEPPCTILLVEDDEPTRDMMRAMLTRDGWSVDEATNGREALEFVERHRPSLILLDLMMPEMDGFEFAARLHEVPAWRSIPVVVLTAKDLTADDRNRLNGYAQRIIQKSGYDRENLLRQVRDLVIVAATPINESLPKPSEE